jgi:hypothetical protein
MSKLWGKLVGFFEGEERKEMILFWLLLGPVFLLASLFLASYTNAPQYDLWLISLLGCYFLAKFPRWGLIFSLGIVVLRSLWKHIGSESHTWQLGLESSIALGFVITHISFQRFGSYLGALNQKLSERETKAVELETKYKTEVEALAKDKDAALESLWKAIAEKKEIEEQSVSLNGLLKTLRTSVKQQDFEREQFALQMAENSKIIRSFELDIQKLREEKEKLKDVQKIKESEEALQQKLNDTRVEKYQAQLINESLAKLLSKEMGKAKDSEKEIAKSSSEIESLTSLLKLREQELEEKLSKRSSEMEALTSLLKTMQQEAKEKEQKEALLVQSLKEEMQKKEQEVFIAKDQIALERTQLLAEVGALKREIRESQEKLQEKHLLAKTYETKFAEDREKEASFIQLRKQFDEKTELLHDTRVQLFHTETKLLAFERERFNSFQEEDESFKQMAKLLAELQEEVLNLENERKELTAFISHLLPVQESLLKPKNPSRKKTVTSEQLPLV